MRAQLLRLLPVRAQLLCLLPVRAQLLRLLPVQAPAPPLASGAGPKLLCLLPRAAQPLLAPVRPSSCLLPVRPSLLRLLPVQAQLLRLLPVQAQLLLASRAGSPLFAVALALGWNAAEPIKYSGRFLFQYSDRRPILVKRVLDIGIHAPLR